MFIIFIIVLNLNRTKAFTQQQQNILQEQN